MRNARSGSVDGYQRLVDQNFPTIQRAIAAMHREYPGPTIVEANSIGKPVIENLHLPESELIEYTTTKASKKAMLTELELLLQQRTLKIHPHFHQLLSELAAYCLPDSSITRDSVMALGFAVTQRQHADASGRINRKLLHELNDPSGPPLEWYDRRKFGNPAAGLIPGRRAPDDKHGGIRQPYKAEAHEIPNLLAQGWTPDDPAILDKLGLVT